MTIIIKVMIMFFRALRIKFLKLGWKQHGNQLNWMFTVFRKNYCHHIHVENTSMIVILKIQINWYFSFIIYVVVKRFMTTKNLVMEIQNLVVNHELQHIKSNPECNDDDTIKAIRNLNTFKVRGHDNITRYGPPWF